MTTLRIATRSSNLALRQTALVAERIRSVHAGVDVELVPMSTRGDRHRGALEAVGGKGVFTRELEDALRAGRVHLAVHSAKDMPAAMAAEFALAAVPPRGDPRDALVSRGGGLDDLPEGAVVGTSSLRRRAQVLALRDDVRIVPVRGNVETRVAKALGEEAELDAVVLAMAGLARSGQLEALGGAVRPLSPEAVIPAGGQGVLALQIVAADARTAELLAPLDDAAARAALEAERFVLRELGAGCHSCVAVHVEPHRGGWRGRAMAARPNGSEGVGVCCTEASAERVGRSVLTELVARGAVALLGGPAEP